MFPWKSVIEIKSPCPTPVYLQIANTIIEEIRQGRVQPGSMLPGTRAMSRMLEVHRKTVVAAYDEIDAQGWIEIQPSRGAFVNADLPEKRQQVSRKNGLSAALTSDKTGFDVESYDNIHEPAYAPKGLLGLHDGPDLRLVPTALIARTYKSVLTRKTFLPNLRYNEVEGNPILRRVLSEYLNESRGLQTLPENIFITRGSQMGMFLTGMALLKTGDVVLTGDPGYYYADRTFTNFGASVVRVETDDNGLSTDAVEDVCKRRKIRMVYVTPHHHFPTTVTLSAARRMELLSLAEKYGFVILEDDYDYDFHYESSPLLPLFSADKAGMVIYIGSLSKTFAPALRVGFMAAPVNLIKEVAKMRQIIDVQGDFALEQTVGELFMLGEIKRHMKKSLKIYHQRRDHFCQQLTSSLGDKINFKIPDGGMSVWVTFGKKIDLPKVAETLRKRGVVISNGLIHDKASSKKWNATRLGFASVNEAEAKHAIDLIRSVVYQAD
jgi:GntR family transcriptional regulator/MocR family aminotransferase